MELRTFHHHHLPQVFILLSLIRNCYARFVVEKKSLAVTSPEKIKATHDSAIGNFGIPQCGGSMAGVVVYPEENRKACKGFDDFGISVISKPGSLPTYVLVDRGDVETNECLENDGGCWQEKAANLTACRIHFEEEFVNVSWLMASNSKEMDTVTVKVRIKILFARINLSLQAVTALAPIEFGYAFCVTTCVPNGTSLGDCIQRCLPSEALVETLEETHLTSSSVFCIVGCAALTCSMLSSQGRLPAAREVAACVNTCTERCAMKN
ncbi:hypothetical protein ES319_D01G009600v1 [Gossypium barbadense]|uniref:Uncharacterized protein n=1 Tax=Gossypium barbadense TaxID=3634 RepID=A0A5J5SM43_GOSBA|nr:hypothetical protein ES319_D01G009600v1 [Gossypium barbadense]PPD79926.1 hypothetical protein GOBAR_DD23156 [Gossypium barbadense]